MPRLKCKNNQSIFGEREYIILKIENHVNAEETDSIF